MSLAAAHTVADSKEEKLDPVMRSRLFNHNMRFLKHMVMYAMEEKKLHDANVHRRDDDDDLEQRINPCNWVLDMIAMYHDDTDYAYALFTMYREIAELQDAMRNDRPTDSTPITKLQIMEQRRLFHKEYVTAIETMQEFIGDDVTLKDFVVAMCNDALANMRRVTAHWMNGNAEIVSKSVSVPLERIFICWLNHLAATGGYIIRFVPRPFTTFRDITIQAKHLVFNPMQALENIKVLPTFTYDGVTTVSDVSYDAITCTMCCLCVERMPNICFDPCGHMKCCQTCSDRIERCPICRAAITKKIVVYA
jgi:hypothetical protein